MRDITTERQQTSTGRGQENALISHVVPGWRGSPALDALEDLMEASESVPGAVAAEAGMSVSEVIALRHLMRGPLGPAELGRLLGVTSAAATGVVDRLEVRGHVERRPHPHDRRRTEVVVTDSARVELVQRLRAMFESLSAMDAEFSDEERSIVLRYLQGAIEAVRTLGTPGHQR